MRKLPLAWLGLIHDRRSLLLALGGVGFAVLLMFVEMGFMNGVYDSQTLLVDALDADLVMINRQKEDLLPAVPFSRRRLVQALGFPGVASAEPVYLEEYRAFYKAFAPDSGSGIVVIGVDPDRGLLRLPGLSGESAGWRFPDTALIDRRSRDLFGARTAGAKAELNGRALTLGGSFELGPNFRTDGFLLMSDRNFLRYFPDAATGVANPDRIEIGLLKLAPGHSRDDAREALNRGLPDDVVVISRSELKDRVQRFWRTYQPIGMIFAIGAAIGFLIGVAVCYQILYTDITDHLPQYATLKALGASDGFLVGLVARKALLLGFCGFGIGLLLSLALYDSLQAASGIRMDLGLWRSALVLQLSLAMCVVAALLAVRRATRLDPAELY